MSPSRTTRPRRCAQTLYPYTVSQAYHAAPHERTTDHPPSSSERRDQRWAVSEGIGSPSRTRQQASAARQLTRTAGAARTNINDFRCGAKRQTVILTGLVAIL